MREPLRFLKLAEALEVVLALATLSARTEDDRIAIAIVEDMTVKQFSRD